MAVRTYRDKTGWTISEPQTVRRRVFTCVAVLSVIFMLLLARLWYMQVVQGEAYLAQAQSNQTRDVPISAPRGLIVDRNGVVLATSRATHAIAVVPAALPSSRRDPEGRARILNTLGFLVGLSRAGIEAQLEEAARKDGRAYDPVRLPVVANIQNITRIEENKARLGAAVLVTNDLARAYPGGELAAHVLGYSGVVTAKDMKKARDEQAARQLKFDDIVGKSGVEKEYDEWLAGTPGAQEYEVDARGRPIRRRGTRREIPGKTLMLTLDARLQKAAEKALDGARNSGAAVAIDPRNGEVLAMASRPTFNPNTWSLVKKDFQKQYLAYNRNPKHPFIIVL
jgi:penicillin-binding protein 2